MQSSTRMLSKGFKGKKADRDYYKLSSRAKHGLETISYFLPLCMECSDENSVCLSVRLSNACIVTTIRKRNMFKFFTPYEISFSLFF